MTLGTYPQMSLADAGVQLAEAKSRLARGQDPGKILVGARKAERQAETVKELAEEYLEKYARPRKRSAQEDERCLGKDVLPFWGDRKVKDITRRDAIILIDRIVDRGAAVMANRALAVVRRMFAFAVDRDMIAFNPILGVKPPTKETRRDRILSEAEIKAFWNGLDQTRMSEPFRLALRLLLATVQRRSEVIEATWSEFDLSKRLWTIGAERAKNGIAHTVPLSDQALELLDRIKTIGNGSRWLFPSRRLEDRPIPRVTLNHALTAVRDDLGVSNFRPHDLRRTGASQMTALGIPRLVVGKILNHAEHEVTAVYDRHSYDPEKRRALDAWGARLAEIVEGKAAAENVVKFTAAGDSE
jgi:integrase